MKKANITKINADGTYNSKFGLMYKFEYELSDGTILTASHKTQECPFKVGDEVEYEIKGTNDYGSYGSVSKPKEQFTPATNSGTRDVKTQDAILLQTCLKISGELHVEFMRKGMGNELPKPQEVLEYAQTLAALSKKSINEL